MRSRRKCSTTSSKASPPCSTRTLPSSTPSDRTSRRNGTSFERLVVSAVDSARRACCSSPLHSGISGMVIHDKCSLWSGAGRRPGSREQEQTVIGLECVTGCGIYKGTLALGIPRVQFDVYVFVEWESGCPRDTSRLKRRCFRGPSTGHHSDPGTWLVAAGGSLPILNI